MSGFFYVGGKTANSVNGYAKIGETGMALSQRIAMIRYSEHNFMLLQYIALPNATKAERLMIESFVRLALERDEYTHTQNDHFTMPITKNSKIDIYNAFADKAINYAIQACKMFNIEYSEPQSGKPNQRKTVKHRNK